MILINLQAEEVLTNKFSLNYFLLSCLIFLYLYIFSSSKINEIIEDYIIETYRYLKINNDKKMLKDTKKFLFLLLTTLYIFYQGLLVCVTSILSIIFFIILFAQKIDNKINANKSKIKEIKEMKNLKRLTFLKNKMKSLFFIFSLILIVSSVYQSVDKMFVKVTEEVISKSFILKN